MLDKSVHDWWMQTLLGQENSAHPVFGSTIEVHVDGEVATISGVVDSVDVAEEIEREALQVKSIRRVVNHLTVEEADREYHWQTVIALFETKEAAELACGVVRGAKIHEESNPRLLVKPEEVKEALAGRAEAAGVGVDAVERYIDAARKGRVILIDRIPEDDALREISALEGTPAGSVFTLPPEPEEA